VKYLAFFWLFLEVCLAFFMFWQSGNPDTCYYDAIICWKQVGCVTTKTRNDWGSLHLALVLPISKCHQENNVVFDEQGGKVKRLIITKNFSYNFFDRNLYLLTLLKGFQNPARKSASARLKNFQLTVRKAC